MQDISDTHEHTVHKVNVKDEHSNQRNKERQQILGTRPKTGNEGRRFPMKAEMRNCTFCGFKHEFQKEKCPAWGKTCHICNGRNHFKSKCKNVHCMKNEKNLTPMMGFG